MKKQKNQNNKKMYRKIKRSSVWGSLIIFFVFSVVAIGVFFYVYYRINAYILDLKIGDEYAAIEQMADLYQSLGESEMDKAKIYQTLDRDTHDYIIVDRDGNTLHTKGTDTRSGEKVLVQIFGKEISAYSDENVGVLRPEADGFSVDIKGFDSFSSSALVDVDDEKVDEYQDFEVGGSHLDVNAGADTFSYFINTGMPDGSTPVLELPVWLVCDVGNTGEQLIGKAVFTLDLRDISLIAEVAAMLILLLLAILITMLVVMIVGTVRQRKVTRYFMTDVITGGNNWMYFQLKGEPMVRSQSGKKVNFAMVSLVFVNYRNYCVCHSVAKGEELLKKIYDTIRANITKKEICAHATSSNFALLLRYEDPKEVKTRLEELVKLLSGVEEDHQFAFQAGVFLVEKNVGEDGKPMRRKFFDLDIAYNNACTARNMLSDTDDSGVALFDEKIVEDQKWLDQVQEHQRAALQNEEFVVYYQPKYNPKTNELSGAEALIRWDSKELGFVTPFRFIPIFEKNGFITEIDHYMITHVAMDQKRWLDQGYQCVPISVNVSRAHFIESDLADQICEMVNVAGCPHDLIEIELTESAFFDDKRAMIRTINRLKDYGFIVSMDDFGAGYSSLNSLKDMPLDVLKLDADFFRGDADGRGEIVVSEAIKLAKNLNMRTVAEGVEAKEQVDFLAAEGCDMIQGYYYAKPMPHREFEQRMKQKDEE